jgi:hypothetical protein
MKLHIGRVVVSFLLLVPWTIQSTFSQTPTETDPLIPATQHRWLIFPRTVALVSLNFLVSSVALLTLISRLTK